MLVMKFGGTSVTSHFSVAKIVKLLHDNLENKPIVVVSALSGITNLLVKLSESVVLSNRQSLINQIRDQHRTWIISLFSQDKLPNNTYMAQIDDYLNELGKTLVSNDFISPLSRHDSIVAFGEKMSSYLISSYLNSQGLNTQQLLATKCIITDDNFGSADFIPELTKERSQAAILPMLENNLIPIITGFIGATHDNKTTVLGRGGSDYSAAIIGYAINATEVQIWTDVDGVFSADPRTIKTAKLIKQLSYQEAAELAMFGAKVLHPRTIKPAVIAEIPLRVLNTFNPENSGTLINHDVDHVSQVKAITWRKNVPLITITSSDMFLSKGFLQKIFTILTENNISANMLSASEVSVSVTLDNTGNLDLALQQLNKFALAEYIAGMGTISLVGEGIMEKVALVQNVFSVLEENQAQVAMLSYSTSNINLSIVTNSAKIDTVLPLLHDQLILGKFES